MPKCSQCLGKILGLLLLLDVPLQAAEFFPIRWLRENLELAKFFALYGEPEEKIRTLQEILEIGSQAGNLSYIYWVHQRHKETNIPISAQDILNAWERLVSGGFDRVLIYMPHFNNILSLDELQQRRFVDLALEIGFPSTVMTLQRLGFTLSSEQQQALEELKEALSRTVNISPPIPINTHQDDTHGGRGNIKLYREEYQKAVAFALYRMQHKPCDFHRLIENLGHRRRHMAVLGKLSGVEMYGVATSYPIVTYFNPTYEKYGEKIREKYPQLPLLVTTHLNGREIYLTQINEDSWVHPDGDYREEILNTVNALCQKVQTGFYPEEKTSELAYDLGKIIWWLSHAPPFLRGTPTIIAILMDALWIYHQRTPLIKSPDLNCEALTFNEEEDFARYLSQRPDLP